jgi:hypothetical protein
MNRSFLPANKRKLFATVLAVSFLLPAASANALWRGFDSDWRCDPKLAYLEEYGFLSIRGPSRSDIRRLQRDRWKASYYRDMRYDPVVKALRKRCPQRARYWW